MEHVDPEAPRLQTLIAALIYLMSHYARTGCPRLAVCVSRHLQCLALHPNAAPAVRDVCASVQGLWTAVAADDSKERALH